MPNDSRLLNRQPRRNFQLVRVNSERSRVPFRPSQPDTGNPLLGWIPLTASGQVNGALSRNKQPEPITSFVPPKRAMLFYEDISHLAKGRNKAPEK